MAGLLLGCNVTDPGSDIDELIAREIELFESDPETTGARYFELPYLQIYELQRFNHLWGAQELTSDEATLVPIPGPQWGNTFLWESYTTHSWTPLHTYLNNIWDLALNGKGFLYQTRTIIDSAVSNPGTQQIIAERSALVAYFDAILIDLFGQVPDVLPDGTIVAYTRAGATSAVIDSLTRAIEVLEGRDRFTDNRTWYRMNKAAAQTLLARMYLNKSVYTDQADHDPNDLNQVIALANEIINSGAYKLSENYWDNFSVANGSNPAAAQEIIWAAPQTDQGSGTEWFSFAALAFGHIGENLGGWNGFATLGEFYDAWDTTDARFSGPRIDDMQAQLGFNEGVQVNNQGDTLRDAGGTPIDYLAQLDPDEPDLYAGVRPVKYELVIDSLEGSSNWYAMMRLGELYLMKAEAQYRLGETGAAMATLNELRTARGVASLTEINEEVLLDEYGFELWWEGNRRTVQIRFGTFNDANSIRGDGSESFRALFPIPNSALLNNPLLEQNPGY